MALVRNLLATVGCLTLLVGGAALAWLYQDELAEWWDRRAGVEYTEPAPELADRAEERLRAFAEGEGDDEIRLSELELRSWVRYRLAPDFPAGVSDATVSVRDSSLEMSAALDLRRLAEGSQAAEGLRRFMGDSARVVTELQPRVEGPGIGSVTVLSLQAGLVPVPPMFIPSVLRQAGFETTGGGRAVVFPVPQELTAIRIEGDEVVLVRGGDG